MKLVLQVLAYCIAVSLIVVLVIGLLTSGPLTGELGTLLAEVWLYTILIATPAHWILPRLYPLVVQRRPAVRWSVFIITLAGISAAGSLAGSVIVFGLNLEPGVTFGEIAWISVRLSVFLAVLVGVIHAIVVLLQDRLETAEGKLRAQELEYERALKLAAEARLAALESRVHPHFLFNALNTVSSLIPTAPACAEGLVQRMSALLRFSLDAHQERVVPLKIEMKILRDYLEIEQARFRGRLRFTMEVNEAFAEKEVPPLSVQTLVENSVKHAVAPNRQGAEIRVRTVMEREYIRIEVADTGPGFSIADLPAGHGLDNLRSRLTMLFGDPDPLRVTRHDGWTSVGFRVPA